MRSSLGRRAGLLLGCGLLAALALGGCRESEQERILLYQKGTYLGQPDKPLSPAQVDDLRHRSRNQGFY